MGDIRAWIRAKRESSFGTLHLFRAQALAEAAVREGAREVTLFLDPADVELIGESLPKQVQVELLNRFTPPQEAVYIVSKIKNYIPRRVDSRHRRPLVYLVGNEFGASYQRTIWKGGAELVQVADLPLETWADWFILPKPYAAEVDITSRSGYTRFLRGAMYSPLRFDSMKAIYRNRDHRTFAQVYAIATENLDLGWLNKIAEAIATLQSPDSAKGWKPSLLLLPGTDDPADEELMGAVGEVKGLHVSVARDRMRHIDELMRVDLLFSPDNTVMQEALALGTVRVSLPRKGAEETDLMMDHLVRREVSPRMPSAKAGDFSQKMQAMLTRASFDPSWRRGQNRIGQYLCDGIGSVRIMRQTAFHVYEVPQNLVRYFEPADPMIMQI